MGRQPPYTVGRAPTHAMASVGITDTMSVTFLILCFVIHHATPFMVMDESSCVEMEQEECKMKMMEEMMPTKVSMCKNITRYENKCQKVMEHKMVEEKRPICKVEMMGDDHAKCENSKSKKCKRVMKCSIGMKMMKKSYPKMVCEKVAIGEEEKCFETVKLKKEMNEAKFCFFHPKIVCKKTDGMECKKVAKKMCDYIEHKR